MNYTSVEQSKKLVELGLDPCTADMTWGEETSDLTKKFEWKVSAGLNVAIKDNLFSYRKGYVLPCWSVGALLEIMPKYIQEDYAEYELRLYPTVIGWEAAYIYPDTGGALEFFKGGNPFDGVYKLIVWLLENNYIKH